MESSGCKSRTAKASTQADSECAIHRATGGCEAYTARKQAVKIQLRKPACCDADAADKAESNIGSTDIARLRRDRRSPQLGACFQRDSPGTQESSPSPFARKQTTRQGKPEANGTDGGAVLRPYSTCEGGGPQGFRKERPRYPLEGRGEQADVSAEGNIGETQNSNHYVPKTRQTI